MSYDELLILRKTLIKFLNKNFIHVSSFSAATLILFIKKFNKELHFYIDYHALNTLI
jgi:hypothetical protein